MQTRSLDDGKLGKILHQPRSGLSIYVGYGIFRHHHRNSGVGHS
jgi:hypothetical protein